VTDKSLQKCHYCDLDAVYLAGVATFDQRDQASQVVGPVCAAHVERALGELNTQCFGSHLWPVICGLDETVLYHAYFDGEL